LSQKSIKITIGGRVYPLTITEKEEQTVLNSAKKIEENINKLQSQYGIKDAQDLLAMTALEFATLLSNKSNDAKEKNVEIDTILNDLVTKLQDIN
jgi:cell division protein ZapA